MKIYEAFRQTLKEFQIPAKKAAEECGVTQGFMSLFLSGKRSTPVENLDEWLERLDEKYCGIKRFFYGLLREENSLNDTRSETLLKFLESADKTHEYFCESLLNELLSQKSLKKLTFEKKIVQLIEAANDDAIEIILITIGRKWKREMNKAKKETSNFTEKITDAIAV